MNNARMIRLVCSALALLGLAVRASADGMIVAHRPMTVPIGHYSFAPLVVKYHHVSVKIDGQIATTSVDQEFYNPNDERLEGTYLFPIPQGAHIDKFTMEVGGQQVEAELLPVDRAREVYADVVRQTRDPALLEYAGRGAFRVRVSPIEAHGSRRITLSYSELLKSEGGLISYTYPLNTEKFSAQPVKSVSVKVELDAKRPLKSIYSPSHSVEIRRRGPASATIVYEDRDVTPDTDFQLFFAPEDNDIGVNLMTFKESGEDGYFLLLASPGLGLNDQPVAPKDVTFVLDTSGSMAGRKLSQAKKALQFCVQSLNEGDRFEIIRFSSDVDPLFNELVEASEGNRKRALDYINKLSADGATAIQDALLKALSIRPGNSNRPYVVIFLTDGQPTVGEVRDENIVANVTAQSGETRIFCFGLGTDVNTHLLDKITEATHAVSQYVLPEEDIETKVSSFFAKIKDPVLTQVKLTFSGDVRVTKLQPTPLPDLYRDDQLLVLGRYTGNSNSTVAVEGIVDGLPRKFTYEVTFPERDSDHEFIPRLWATRRIGYLLDQSRLHGENQELRDEITELARKYGIVTPYTAYLIVDDESHRNVPTALRSMQRFDGDLVARNAAGSAWQTFNRAKAGETAVAGARASYGLTQSAQVNAGVSAARQETQRALSAAAPSDAPVVERISQYTQQTRFVEGRTFFQNGNQWIDAQVQQMVKAQHVPIKFGSPEYFALIAKFPQALSWLSLGRNVQFAIDNTVYVISE